MPFGLTPTMLPDAAAIWRGALENLSPNASPCRYLLPAKWAAIREAGIEFCDRLGAEAHRLGWTAPELFAVHPEHGTLRVDHCGALLFSGKRPMAVEASRIVFESESAYRNKPGQMWG
ncbi:hypothetical protein, partial [Methylobacterium sp. J-076]|uniref:hypothetical protein n=1 Tax=Methylobacterium sp. J-076 TaxID=2836655 RepID=UPI001FB9FC65